MTQNRIATIPWWIETVRTAALCTGCFDVLHRGHVELLVAASRFARVLVGVNSDAAVRRLKGPTRPINNQADRMFVVGAIAVVEGLFLIDSDTVSDAIRTVRPKFWVKSTPWTMETLNREEIAAANDVGAQIVILPAVEGYSSTKTIERMRA